jgi:hypothetical protein
MNIELSPIEARVIGCLMEKSVTTPDQYPLTLNALVNACNQKSSRDPVMQLEPGAVQQVVRALEVRHLLVVDENFKSRVEKYDHRFCNTPFADLQLSPPQFAIICVLLLRGPQTPGELRTRCNRLFAFADNAAVQETLEELLVREGGALVARLPRLPGRQDHQYAQLFCGELESVAAEVAQPAVQAAQPDRLAALEARLAALEAQLEALRGGGSSD